jgi:hypothetical protein
MPVGRTMLCHHQHLLSAVRPQRCRWPPAVPGMHPFRKFPCTADDQCGASRFCNGPEPGCTESGACVSFSPGANCSPLFAPEWVAEAEGIGIAAGDASGGQGAAGSASDWRAPPRNAFSAAANDGEQCEQRSTRCLSGSASTYSVPSSYHTRAPALTSAGPSPHGRVHV